jgi:predicted MFS family arabinose efflux permease
MSRIGRRARDLARPFESRGYRFLWVSQLASQLGDWSARLAMQALVYEQTGDPARTAAVFAVSLLPWLGLGQILATLGDRFDRRHVLIACDLSRGSIFLLLASVDVSYPVLLVAAFVAGSFDPPFEAARSATIPRVASGELYPLALSLSSITNQVGLLGGYALGGVLVGLIGAQGTLALNAASFGLSALMLVGLGAQPPIKKTMATVTERIRVSARIIRGDVLVSRALLSFALIGGIGMSIEGQALVFAARIPELSPTATGFFLAALPVGTVAGTFALRTNESPYRLLRLTGAVAFVGGFGALVLFPFGAVTAAGWFAYFMVGVAFTASVPSNTVAGIRIPDEHRSSVFGILQGVIMGSFSIGIFVGGQLAGIFGVQEFVVTASALLSLVGFWAWVRAPGEADAPLAGQIQANAG